MILDEDVYKIGYISKTHGLHGEVNFHFTDDVFDIAGLNYLLIRVDGIIVPFFMDSYRFRSDDVALVKLIGFDSVEKSQRLVGCDVVFERRIAEESSSEELSLDYFIGYNLVNMPNISVGKIIDIDTQTENYLFLVNSDDGKEYYIPIQDSLIDSIDHSKKTLYMNLPDGILDL